MSSKPGPDTRDYFAELYVAGILGDAGWSVYFPKRDVGFDFIISKEVNGKVLIRPVQVKGKYPTAAKKNFPAFGYIGKLSQVHEEMVLAIPFFPVDKTSRSPLCVAYMPFARIRRNNFTYYCEPAQFKEGHSIPRRDYRKFFDQSGIRLIELPNWKNEPIGNHAPV